MVQRILLLSSVAAFGFSGVAFAQQASPVDPPAAAGAPNAEGPATPSSTDESEKKVVQDHQASGLAEIVVTAAKRTANLQKTPAAITAVSGMELQSKGITNIFQLTNILPSVRLNSENTEVKAFMRGVGSDIGLPWIAESVSTYMNGGLVQRYGSTSSFFDIDSVQILPGPQGTLYGRNSVGGTIQVTSKRPSWEQSGDALFEYGNYDLIHGAVNLNVPANHQLAFRFASNFQHHHGYQSEGTDSEGSYAGRISALWKPEDNFTAFLWGQYWQNRFHSPAFQNLPFPDPRDPWYVVPVSPPLLPGMPGVSNRQALSTAHTKTIGAQFDWRKAGMMLTYIPFWISFGSDEQRAVDGFHLPYKLKINEQMHELRLTSDKGSRLTWLAGANYMSSKGELHYVFGPNLSGYDGLVDQENYSVYAQVTYAVRHRLRLTAGGRYSWDRLNVPHALLTSPDANFNPVITPFFFDKQWKKFDWKVGFEADVASHSMLYGNVQTGHNQGTYNTVLNSATFNNEVKPQNLLGFTLGMKNRFLDGDLEVNLEGYYYRYKDFLLSTYDANVGTGIEVNAPRAGIKGAQIDIRYLLNTRDLLTANIGVLDAKIDRFVDRAGKNYAGSRLPNAPVYTANLGYQHTFPLASGAAVIFRVDALVSASYWGIYSHDPFTEQAAYSKTDLTLTYYSPDKGWDIGAWVRNIENRATLSATSSGGLPGPAAAYIDPPRTFGMKLHATF